MDKQNNTKWTAKMVSAQMEEAARTLHLLRVSGLKPRGYVSSWPDVVLDPDEALGRDEAELRANPPTPEAITRMDEALQWLCWLEPDPGASGLDDCGECAPQVDLCQSGNES